MFNNSQQYQMSNSQQKKVSNRQQKLQENSIPQPVNKEKKNTKNYQKVYFVGSLEFMICLDIATSLSDRPLVSSRNS